MKDGFTSAVEAMGEVQYGDRVLQEKVDNNKAEQDEQLADVVNMVLALKVNLMLFSLPGAWRLRYLGTFHD